MDGVAIKRVLLMGLLPQYVCHPLQNGDKIVIDVEKRVMDMKISDQELAARKAAWKAPPLKVRAGRSCPRSPPPCPLVSARVGRAACQPQPWATSGRAVAPRRPGLHCSRPTARLFMAHCRLYEPTAARSLPKCSTHNKQSQTQVTCRTPPPQATSGTLYKYIKNVSSASTGCVTDS